MARDQLIGSSISPTLHWILRVAVAVCFIGHRAFGLITKAAWVPYFAMFGIPEALAWKLMPVVGAVDISVGVLTLIQPVQRDQEIRQLPELALTKLGGSRR